MQVKILLGRFRWHRVVKRTLILIAVFFVVFLLGLCRLNSGDFNTQGYDTSKSSNKDHSAELHPNETWAPFKDVSARNAKLVVLLSYQRSGSTLLGQLFNNHSDVFYQFEPLDSLYSSLYGTAFGWNVPSDIAGYENGSLRIPPKSESDQVSLFLRRLFTCDMDSLPTATLIHPYQFQMRYHFRSSESYISCLKHTATSDRCYKSLAIKKLCGLRFGGRFEDKQLNCNRLLSNPDDNTTYASDVLRKEFRQRQLCERRERELINRRCSSQWLNACQQQEIRAVKVMPQDHRPQILPPLFEVAYRIVAYGTVETEKLQQGEAYGRAFIQSVVRATMHSMNELLHSFDNLRVIHLIRDPRGVSLSRSRFGSSARGSYTDRLREKNERLIGEAKLYCQTVAEDIRIRSELERRYPGRILTIVYDDMVGDIRGYIRKIYRFLDLPTDMLEASYEAMGGSIRLSGKKSKMTTSAAKKVAGKWSELTFDVRLKILRVCSDFFELANDYEWKI